MTEPFRLEGVVGGLDGRGAQLDDRAREDVRLALARVSA